MASRKTRGNRTSTRSRGNGKKSSTDSNRSSRNSPNRASSRKSPRAAPGRKANTRTSGRGNPSVSKRSSPSKSSRSNVVNSDIDRQRKEEQQKMIIVAGAGGFVLLILIAVFVLPSMVSDPPPPNRKQGESYSSNPSSDVRRFKKSYSKKPAVPSEPEIPDPDNQKDFDPPATIEECEILAAEYEAKGMYKHAAKCIVEIAMIIVTESKDLETKEQQNQRFAEGCDMFVRASDIARKAKIRGERYAIRIEKKASHESLGKYKVQQKGTAVDYRDDLREHEIMED